jgi:hypothetical protein
MRAVMCQRPSPRIALALTLLAASLSWAQEEQTTPLPGFELEQFEANPGRGAGLLGSGETLLAGGLRLMVLGNYGYRPLLLRNQGEQVAIVSDRVVGLLSGAYGVFSWLSSRWCSGSAARIWMHWGCRRPLRRGSARRCSTRGWACSPSAPSNLWI